LSKASFFDLAAQAETPAEERGGKGFLIPFAALGKRNARNLRFRPALHQGKMKKEESTIPPGLIAEPHN
jgi:hypothetical protein